MAKLTYTEKFRENVPFEEAISMTGYGRFNILLLLATGGGLMCVAIETMCMMFIIPAAQCDLNLSLTEKGILSSISFFGVVSGSHMWGYLADTRGRKNVLILSLAISSLSTFISSLIPWDWLFIILRFVNGFFIGGASSVVYAFAGEFHDNHFRPKVISWMSTFVAFGNMFLPSLAWIILPQEWSYNIAFLSIVFKPWRLLLIIYALPSLICALALYYFPESPKYLLTKNKHDEVLHILRRMYSINSGRSENDFEVASILWENLAQDEAQKVGMLQSMWKQTVPLFKGELLLKTLMICWLQFGIFASNAGIVMWYPEILNRMSHFAVDVPDQEVGLCNSLLYEETHNYGDHLNVTKVCKDTVKTDVFLVTLLMAVAYAMTFLVIGTIIAIVGKKRLLISLISITTISGLISQFVYGYGYIQILVGVFLLGGAGIGITNAIAVDLFPTQVRAMALAISLMFGRIGAMTGTNVVGPILFTLCDYLFYIVTASHILLVIVVFFLRSTTALPKLISNTSIN